MHIGHYIQGLGDPGGIATYIHRISQAQMAAGHQVYWFDTRPVNSQLIIEAYPVVVCNDDDLYHQARSRQVNVLHLHTSVSKLPPPELPVVRTVHDHNPYCPSGSRYLKNWGKPCDRAYHPIGCLWGHFIDHCGSIRPAQLSTEFQRLSQEMKTLSVIPTIANSQFVKEQMLRSGYLEDQLDLLLLPVPDSGEYLPPPEDEIPHFLFVGRITPEKGWRWLLQALATLKTPIHLDIAGTGNPQQNQAIRELTAQLGLEEKITFHGWVNEGEVRRLMQQSRAVIFPSVWHEPAGLVSLEAAAAGRAVIASQVGGLPEYVGKLKNGLLVEPNDVQGLAEAIAQLAQNYYLAQQLGVEGYKMVQMHFSLEQHLADLMQLYEQTINKDKFYF